MESHRVLAEGFGLWLEASWAAYMTVISTSIFLPVEFYDVVRRLSIAHVTVLLINMAIVIFLMIQLARRQMR